MPLSHQQNNAAPNQFSGSTVQIVNVPGSVGANDLLLVVFGFENVAAGSGPWVSGTPQAGWSRLCYQAPAGTGSGLEIWTANWTTGPSTTFNFFAAMTGVIREGRWRCSNGIRAIPYGAVTQTHTGDNPIAPSMTTTEDVQLVFAACAMELASPGFTAPAGYAEHIDNTRAGFGTVEITIADISQAIAGASGTATFTATTATGTDEGATAAFAAGCADTRVCQLPYLHAGP